MENRATMLVLKINKFGVVFAKKSRTTLVGNELGEEFLKEDIWRTSCMERRFFLLGVSILLIN